MSSRADKSFISSTVCDLRQRRRIGYFDVKMASVIVQNRKLPIVSDDVSLLIGAPVAKRVKHCPTDLVDRVRSSLEVKSSQP